MMTASARERSSAGGPISGAEVGALLRQARRVRGLTQRDLASRTGIAQTTIARIESGRTHPTTATVARLLAGTGFRAQIELVNTIRPSELLDRHRDAILAAAAKRRISRVRVFGSVARGADGPDSDLDLLVDFKPEASLFDQAGFAGDVEDLLGVGVDVVSADALAPPRDRNILRDAKDL
ncbi:MAG: helix-turn-helix domain-containing protein [Nocardioides sp.]|uniref:helix-turn-helix domain-containing protein n=1 Tax=Nocardioides sp. TaxID=35761 RepID=UPI003D6C603C